MVDELKLLIIVDVKPITQNISKWSYTLPKLHVWKKIVGVNLTRHKVSKWSDKL